MTKSLDDTVTWIYETFIEGKSVDEFRIDVVLDKLERDESTREYVEINPDTKVPSMREDLRKRLRARHPDKILLGWLGPGPRP